MKWNLVILTALFSVTAISATAYGQATQCPQGMICISQAAANQAAANARELEATKAKVTVLEVALTEKDKSIDELRTANKQNIVDLTAQNTKLLTENGMLTGQVTELKADKVMWAAVVDVLIKIGETQESGANQSVLI
jgi:hypothetical protein